MFRPDVNAKFAPVAACVLEPNAFRESDFVATRGEFAAYYDNDSLRVQLIYDHYGTSVRIAPPDNRTQYFDISLVLSYLTGDTVNDPPVEQVAQLFSEHYAAIIALFGKRDASWAAFEQWLDAFNRKRFKTW
jgi:hypothetical protein